MLGQSIPTEPLRGAFDQGGRRCDAARMPETAKPAGESTNPPPGVRGCVFCGIAYGREPALFFQPEGAMFVDSRRGDSSVPWAAETPDVFVFENQYLFFDLTSLVIPRGHGPTQGQRFYSQQVELWRDVGSVGRVAREHAVRALELMAERRPDRAPQGFRIFCNFGAYGEQSQPHAHLQVHADRNLDISRFAPTGEPWPAAVQRLGGQPAAETESTLFYDALPVLEAGRNELWKVTVSMGLSASRRSLPPLALLAVPRSPISQWALWENVGQLGADAVALAERESLHGFRLLSNFPGPERAEDWGAAHILLLGGAPLGLYADYY